MNIVYKDEQGVLNVNFSGKVRVGDRDGASAQVFIDTESGITDIGGEGSDNFIRIEQGKVQIVTSGKVQMFGESMAQPCGAEPSDGDLQGGQLAFFADESNGRIRFKFRDSQGVIHVDDVGTY
jgi:hypothetical protein